ncbi:MAG: 5'-nucleotidase C-terminal domain-containing protein [Proteobacteria bacterium]|nr:5'-nucleotidase C-terminal domain-containing protein [Pseudomonadota bacterium]
MLVATLLILQSLVAPLEIVYHADLEGQMAVPRCGEAGEEEPDYAAQVAVIRKLRQDATDRGGSVPITLLGGDQIAPDLFVRSILKRDGEAGARDLVAALVRAGYDAITLGNHELSTERDRLDRFVAATARAGIPIVVSNLRCDVTRQAFCKHVQREVMLVRGADKIGVLGVISPKTLATIAKTQLVGITLEDLGTAIPTGVARLRAAGATTVVVMVQVNSGRAGVDEVLALQRTLPLDRAPDVLLASGMADADGQRATVLVRQDRSPPVVGSSTGARGVTHVTLAPSPDGPIIDARAVPSRLDQRDDETARLLAPHVADYCARFGVPIGAGTGPTTKPALLAYTLDVLQRTTHAEIALVNTGLVFGHAFPMTGKLTHAKLKRAMPHAAVVGTLSVAGAALADLLATGEASGRIAFVGAARPAPGKDFQINGRAIDKARSYELATIDFVAQGGDGGYANDQLKAWQPLRGHPDVRELVESELARGATFDTPASARLLTSGIGDLIADLSNTSIANVSGLGDSQLARAEQRAYKLELNALLQLDHPDHRWDTRLNVKFGYARTQPIGMPAAAQETLDLVQLTSLYSYRGLYQGDVPPPAIPSPYSRVSLESELTVPTSRTYRHAELTHTFGALFTVNPRLKLRVGAGYRTELLANRDSVDPMESQVGRVRMVAEAGATVDPFAIATVRRLAIMVEGSLDYFLLDPGGRTEHQGRASGKLSLPLLPLLFLTAGVDIFMVDRDGAGRGASFDTTIGLKLHLDATHQAM